MQDMHIPLPTEAEFMAETTRRHEACWGGVSEEQRQKYMADAMPRMLKSYRDIVAALDGPRERQRSVVEWAMYRAFVDPLVTAETHIALRLWNLFDQAYSRGRSDERAEIRQALRAELADRVGKTAETLIVEEIEWNVDSD